MYFLRIHFGFTSDSLQIHFRFTSDSLHSIQIQFTLKVPMPILEGIDFINQHRVSHMTRPYEARDQNIYHVSLLNHMIHTARIFTIQAWRCDSLSDSTLSSRGPSI
ncbi:hypothetical protein ACN38_g6429 [Penicillium nordicum]|uniref:Uncharacterized protein n=1 Tax=Penicillium nordicum TaxID=229535 RepID=A0A0M8P844_9EURO|nr:hypothetical protein ACN38_g6429 [Penicillium nordicum]